MKIQIINETPTHIDFLVEREQGMYNNVNMTAEFYDGEKHGLTQGQVYQLAWDKVKPIPYRVFEQIMPLEENERFIGFNVEPLPIIEQPIIEQPISEIEELKLLVADLTEIVLGGI